MKKNKKKIIIIVAVILAVLFIPVPCGPHFKDGTRAYTAFTYKVVVWNIERNDIKAVNQTAVYRFPDNFRSNRELYLYTFENVAFYPR